MNLNSPQRTAKQPSRQTRSVGVCLLLVMIGMISSAGAETAQTPNTSDQPITLNQFVVTAAKRTQTVFDVPSSLSVVSTSVLDKTSPLDITDLNGLIPGLSITDGGGPGRVTLVMRGVFVGNANTTVVASYIDDVPMGSSAIWNIAGSVSPADLMPFDIDRIEALNGPQGTLYGASSVGGLVRYIFKDPQLEETQFNVGGEAFYTDHTSQPGDRIHALINLPLVANKLAVRVSAVETKVPGYTNNVILHKKGADSYTQNGGRLSVLWKPTNNLVIKGAAMFQNVVQPDGKSVETIDPATLKPAFGEFHMSSFVPLSWDQHVQLYYVNANLNLGYATLTADTSFQSAKADQVSDLTPVWSGLANNAAHGAYPTNTEPYKLGLGLDKFVEEVRLASKNESRLQWLVGAFYTRERSSDKQYVEAHAPDGTAIPDINPFFANNGFPANYFEGAVYTNDTLTLGHGFSLNAGARYATNKQSSDSASYGGIFGPTHVSLDNPASGPTLLTLRQNVTTWTAALQWRLDRIATAYAKVATGYQPGGPTNAPPTSGAPLTFTPDKLTSYELGAKGNVLDSKLGYSVAIYDSEWKDVQETVVAVNVGGLKYLGNGGDARTRGGEAQCSYLVAPGLTLGATVGLVNAYLIQPAPGIGGIVDARLPGSSRLNGSLTLDYEKAFNRNNVIGFGGAFRYASDMWYNAVSSSKGAYLVNQPNPVDLYARWKYKNVNFSFYVRNAFDSEPEVKAVTGGAAAYPKLGSLTLATIRPRTFGLGIQFEY